ncbi:hypothetical protein [Streptomyces hoynatensis]|uniref:Secreted protein n=1 Tax=Streptomyces hoynatensis TaxID=1141874 RepID=A0A3A9Z3W9_9ACTN|nr:hypothetical protein [Streptomyces hoynatensis]RKN43121.1 hypothetical protein D7294_11570 [Streptomyces hoynatensis]
MVTTRVRTLLTGLSVGAAALAALGLGGGTAVAAERAQDSGGYHVLDYYQYMGTYGSHDACVEAAQPYLWPTNPGGADGYECRDVAAGWDLYLIFAT